MTKKYHKEEERNNEHSPSREGPTDNPEPHFSITLLPLSALMISVHKLAGKRLTGEKRRMGAAFRDTSVL